MSAAVRPVVTDLRREMIDQLATVEFRCAFDHPLTIYVPQSTPVRTLQAMTAPCPLCGGTLRIHHTVAPNCRVATRIRPSR